MRTCFVVAVLRLVTESGIHHHLHRSVADHVGLSLPRLRAAVLRTSYPSPV